MPGLSELCNTLSKNITTKKCLPKGGIKTRAWIGQVADKTGAYTYKANGALSSFVLGEGAKFITATGRPKKGSGASAITKGEEGAASNEQTIIIEVAYATQHEADAIMELLNAENKFVFLETNAKTIRGYFWEFGDQTASAEEGTGTAINDPSGVVKITLKGAEEGLPIFFEAVNADAAVPQLQASIDYLDSLVTGAEVID
jgi:hypothetical protein